MYIPISRERERDIYIYIHIHSLNLRTIGAYQPLCHLRNSLFIAASCGFTSPVYESHPFPYFVKVSNPHV